MIESCGGIDVFHFLTTDCYALILCEQTHKIKKGRTKCILNVSLTNNNKNSKINHIQLLTKFTNQNYHKVGSVLLDFSLFSQLTPGALF